MAHLGVLLRSTLFFLAALCITPPYALLAWMVWPLPARLRYRIVTSWSHLIVALARSICRKRNGAHRLCSLRWVSLQRNAHAHAGRVGAWFRRFVTADIVLTPSRSTREQTMHRALLIIALAGLLAGCGLKGPLYPPGSKPPTKQPVKTDTPTPAASKGTTP
jgi:predicted small lipoprotein YifL